MSSTSWSLLKGLYREEKSLRHVVKVAKLLDDNKPKTSLKKWIYCVLNFIVLIQFHLILQILAKFSQVESERTVFKCRKRKTTFVLCSPRMKRACEIRNFHVTGLQRRQRNEQNSVMHVKFVVLSIKTYYFSAVLLPSPVVIGFVQETLVLLSSRNSATKKVHGDVTSLFSFLLCYPLSVKCVLQWSYPCDLASLRSFQSPLGLQHYSRGRRRRSTAMTKFNFKFFSRIRIK